MECPCSRLSTKTMHARLEVIKEKKPMLKKFIKDEQGQDLIEYTLLVAFVCLATSALFVSSGGSLSGIWITANSRLGAANTSAS